MAVELFLGNSADDVGLVACQLQIFCSISEI